MYISNYAYVNLLWYTRDVEDAYICENVMSDSYCNHNNCLHNNNNNKYGFSVKMLKIKQNWCKVFSISSKRVWVLWYLQSNFKYKLSNTYE